MSNSASRKKIPISDLLIGEPHEVVWWAAQGDDIAMINYAVEHLHAPLDTPDRRHGATPFYIACAFGRVDACIVLMTNKADLEFRCHGNMGATGFWVACAEGHVGVVELLAGKMHSTTLPKVDIRSPNDHGVEPLDIARSNGHKKLVKLLKNRLDFASHYHLNSGSASTPFSGSASAPQSRAGASTRGSDLSQRSGGTVSEFPERPESEGFPSLGSTLTRSR